MALQPGPDQRIDRQTTPPFLLRMYYRQDDFHSPSEFTTVPPSSSLQKSSLEIYTWSDAKLSELTNLLISAKPDLIPSPAAGTLVGYRLVFPDTRSIATEDARGRWLSKPLGSVVIGGEELEKNVNEDADHEMQNVATSETKTLRMSGDAERKLADARFVIGDYISCAILPCLPDGSVAPLPREERAGPMSGRLGPPRGGFGGRDTYRGRGAHVPAGDWRRGERIPEDRGFVPDSRY